jgi:phosphatidylglycerol:prolipoprotein diacylglycerol transferase
MPYFFENSYYHFMEVFGLNQINFPGLGLYFKVNSVAFNLFGKDIYWYGIILSFAFLTGISISLYLTKYSEIDKESLLDFIIVLIPFSIIGARIYYVIFKIQDYKYNKLEVFKIWHGGLAIYGGIIAAIATGIIFSRLKKINFFNLADIIVPGLVIGQTIGRWGNFVNKEAYGYETTVPWRMQIMDYYHNKFIAVHPTFFYESAINFMLFIFLIIYFKKRKFSGEVFSIYMIVYGFTRFLIENMRSDSLLIYNLRISAIVSLILVLLGIYTYIYAKKISKKM